MSISLKRFFIFNLLFSCLVSCSSHQAIDGNPGRDPASFQTCLLKMKKIINYRKSSKYNILSFANAKTLDELDVGYGDESIIEIQKVLLENDIHSSNEHLNELLEKPIELIGFPDKKKFVNFEEASKLFQETNESTVNRNNCNYDPAGTVGFCFGRATITHMEAIIENVHPDAIKKIWIVGDMGKWGHHVATMIKSEDGWVVLDTEIGRVISSKDWIAINMKEKAKDAKETMIFVTQAGRFGPYNNNTYNPLDLFNSKSENYDRAQDFYRGYFHDYFEELDGKINPAAY